MSVMSTEDIPPLIDLNEIRNIPDSVLREKVAALFDQFQHYRDGMSSLQKGQVDFEQEIFELQQQNENLGRKLHETTQVAGDVKEQLKIYESEKTERTRRLFELEALHNSNESEKANLKRQCDQLLAEKNSLAEVIENKNGDLETKKAEIQSLREELRAAVTQRCEMLIKLGGLESRELAVEYRENRLKEERELLVQEKEWLSNELRERDQTVQQLRKENNKRALEYQTTMAAKDDELNETKLALENSSAQCGRFTEQLESLNKKIKEAADERAVKDESYEKELQCQIRLVQVYKHAAEEAESKVEELATSLDNIQQLFTETKEKHFTTQEEIKQLRIDFENEMKTKDETIAELRDELEKANDLLRSKHRVMLTDEEVAALSPAAAAASKLIKSGSTLTQIYRDHMKMIEELEHQKLENKRIEGYFRELVQDIENKAPILRQQQEAYSRSLTVVENLKRQLSEASKTQQTISNDKDTVTRQLTYTKAELERYQRDNADLSAQVRELLWCVERYRSGDGQSIAIADICREPTADDLRLFRNIDDLQSQHQRCLSALREAEARRDEMVKAAQEAEMSKIRAEIDGTMREVEELRNQREKQNQLLEAVRDERDTYKRLLTEAGTQQEAEAQKTAASQITEAPELQSVLEKTRIEFDVYRTQKNETEKILREKLEKCEVTIAELRTTTTKLNAEVEYQTERFRILSGNVDTYKKEIAGLRERNEKSSEMLGKHQQTIQHVTDELLCNSEELSRLRVENGRLQEQLHMSRKNESMSQQELELLRKNQHTHQMVSLTLQELDTRLKRREAEDALKLKSDLEGLTRERNNLQATIKAMTEQNKEYIHDCRVKITTLEAKVDDEQRQAGHLRSQLQWTEEQLQNANSKTEELKNELEKLQSSYQDASGGRYQKEAQQLQTRLNYLELRYTESNKKIEELTEQLSSAQNETQHYRRLADSLEGGLKEYKDTSQVERSRYETEIADFKSRIQQLTAENQSLTNEIVILKQSVNELLRQGGEKEIAWDTGRKLLEQSLAESKKEAEEWKKHETELQTERDRVVKELEEFREKFEHEFLAHGATRAELANVQEELQTSMNQFNALEAEHTTLTQDFESRVAAFEQTEAENEAKLQTATERWESTKQQNELLLNEIEKLSGKVAMFEQLSGTLGEESDSSTLNISDSESSSSAIVEVIRCLRTEKQQLAEKNDFLEADVRRLTSREQMLEKNITSLKTELEAALSEASVAAAATAEKSRLLAQINNLQLVQQFNKDLESEIQCLKATLDALRQELQESQDSKSKLHSEMKTIQGQTQELAGQAEMYKQEAETWQKRYHELVEEKSKFEPAEKSEMRKVHDEIVGKVSDLERRLDELSSQNDTLRSESESLKTQIQEFQNVLADRERTLKQVRQLAVKYKQQHQEATESVNSLQEEIEALQTEKDTLEAEKKESEARCNLLEQRSKQNAVASLDPISDAALQIAVLQSKLDDSEKKLTSMKTMLAEAGNKVVAAQAEKKQLEQAVAHVKDELAKAEQAADERQFRLDSLVSLHSRCEAKIQDLTAQLTAQNEQYQAEKSMWEKQVQEGKASTKPTPVQLVSAMPAGAAAQPERPIAGGNHEQRTAPIRPSRQFPTVASVRPIASQRATAPVPPTAVSPGPSYPDQSSAVSSLLSAPVAISPAITSSSQQVSNTGVPHAVVQPHIESVLGAVSGSMDASADISSSVVISIETGTSEASAAPEPEAPIVVHKRRPPQDPSDRNHKRARAASPEQVSTSEQHAGSFMLLPSLPEEIIESGAGFQPIVGSSADDSSSDVIFIEEVDRGVEPESSGQDQGFDEARVAVANLGSTDAGSSRAVGRQQHSMGQAMQWDMGDDGIVPSTPTLFSRRPDQDVGAAAHVPQPRFLWNTGHVQEPIPTQQIISMPPMDTVAAQRNVPSTPRVVTPPEITEREAASSSTVSEVINVSSGDQQPQPSGQAAESELVEIIGVGGEEEPEGTSEALAAKPEGDESDGDENSNEPTTSQPRSRVIRLRRDRDPLPGLTESEGGAGSLSQPATSTVSGSVPTARRGRLFSRARFGQQRGGRVMKKE